VTVLADEALDPAATPGLVARLGGSSLPFTYRAASSTATSAVFDAVVPLGLPDGDYVTSVALTDVAGNVALTTAGLPPVRIKTSAPTLAVDQNALVFVRSPWGSSQPQTLGSYTIPAGPYFAVEPFDVLTTSASLPAGSLTLAGGALPSAVVVVASGGASPQTLGTLLPSGGRFPRRSLASPDLGSVWLVGVDDAGNRSAAVHLTSAEWVATPNPPAFGASPNPITWTGRALATRAQDVSLEQQASLAALSAPDGASTRIVSAADWQQIEWFGDNPGRRANHAMAYDTARGRVVLFGGQGMLVPSMQSVTYGDTWEWDGTNWRQVATTGPSARYNHDLAYDAARGRVVLYGGTTGALETWEWDGVAWVQRGSAGPSGGTALAYDPVRARVVLLAAGALWEWSGTAWTLATAAGPTNGVSMAYDAAHGRMVVGTAASTWMWDGALWTSTATATAGGGALAYDVAGGRVLSFLPSATYAWNGATAWTLLAGGKAVLSDRSSGYAVAYDVARSRLVMYGGFRGGPQFFYDTWEWNGSTWSQYANGWPAGPGALTAYDSARGRVVLWSGGTWEWDGSSWTAVAATGPTTGSAMAYDSVRQETVLVASGDSSTWLWDGATWTSVNVPGPAPAAGRAMAFDPAHGGGRIVLFGGSDALTWLWNGTSWTSVNAAGPGARSYPALAYFPPHGRVLLNGGLGADSRVWEWDGTSAWSTVVGDPSASQMSRQAMVYDGGRQRLVMYGGASPATGYSMPNVWEWNGNTWTALAASPAGPRDTCGMAYDAARSAMVVFGGRSRDIAGTQTLTDTWVWHVGSTDRPAFQFQASAAALGIDASMVTTVRVRVNAGGSAGVGGNGAALLGWAARGPANEPGDWRTLIVNATAASPTAPYLPAPASSFFEWRSSSPAEARRYLVERDGLAFQIQPFGAPGSALGGAAAALDFIEVRVRYTVPP
jgi:hypothetical protein